MAEAAGLVASIIAIIQIADRIVGVTKHYIETVQDAPRDLHRIRTELSTLKAVFESLQFVHSLDPATSFTLRALDGPAGAVEICKNIVIELEKLLHPSSSTIPHNKRQKIKGTWEALAWPFKESKVGKLLEDLSRIKTTISLALSSETTQTVLSTQSALQDLSASQKLKDRFAQRLQVIEWLTPIDYGLQQSDIFSIRQPGTGQWLLGSQEFQTWLHSDKHTLFCPGIPGTGKTVLTSIVIEHLTTRFQHESRVGIGYIFCNFRRKDDQRIMDLLLSLLKQLTQGKTILPECVDRLYENHTKRRTRPSLDEILQALQVVAISYSKVFIIVDALDECQTSNGCRHNFLSELFTLQQKWNVNIFGTSRFLPAIEALFQGSPSLEIRARREDILAYTDGHMSQLPSFVRGNHQLQQEIAVQIIQAVDGIFLLARLHLDSLTGKRSPKALRTALAKLPTGSAAYDCAYEDAMHRIEGQIADQKELAKDVLMWIICTRRPLNTSELRTALAVEVGENEFDEDNLPEIEDMVSVCAGLVIVDEESNIIRLVHYTTQEYFERTQDRWFPNAETGITISCVTYVSFLPFQSGILTNDKELDSRLKSNPLYAYAATYWGQHAYKAFESSSNNTSSRLCQQVLAFLENPALVESSSQLVANVGQHFWYTFRNTLFLKNVRGVHLAAHFGLGSVVMELIRRGQSPDLKDSYGRSALEWAATNGQAGVVKALLDVFGVDCDLRDFSGRTPLSQAAENGEDAVVRLLLDSGKVDVNSQDNYGRTPLSWAAENGRESTVSLLLGNDLVNVDCTDRTSRTPLMWAAAKGHAGVAQLLLDTGKVDVNARDMLGESALDRSGMKDLVVGGRRP